MFCASGRIAALGLGPRQGRVPFSAAGCGGRSECARVARTWKWLIVTSAITSDSEATRDLTDAGADFVRQQVDGLVGRDDEKLKARPAVGSVRFNGSASRDRRGRVIMKSAAALAHQSLNAT